jgi:hypothetical protein
VKDLKHIFFTVLSHTNSEVKMMNKEKIEKAQQKKEQDVFNSVTNSIKPRNQNQEHNVREEGIGPKNNKK